jgi:hypothetical protein
MAIKWGTLLSDLPSYNQIATGFLGDRRFTCNMHSSEIGIRKFKEGWCKELI